MAIPTQDVQVIAKQCSPISTKAMDALEPPSEEALREELVRAAELVDPWFESLPKSSAQPSSVKEIALNDRKFSGEVRSAFLELQDGTELPAETIHFKSSPEVWLVRTLEDRPGVPQYSAYSWYAMHQPSVQHFSKEGEIFGGTKTNHTHPIQDLLSSLYTSKRAIEDIEAKSKITGEPQYRDDQILEYLKEHADDLEMDVTSAIEKLPYKVIEASVKEKELVTVGGDGPFNRGDLTFFVDGDLQIDAVRDACPRLMQTHDILKLHGFSPVLETQLFDGGSEIPFLFLHVRTDEALPLVEEKRD